MGCGAQQGTLPEERKIVTVLFADIEGSTGMIAGIDPEAADSCLEPALTAMRHAVSRFGGTVNRIAGDGIMALFGAPQAVEDHAARACRAALDMVRAVARLGPLAPRIRVGLHSGEVVVRAIDNDYATDYDAIGDTPHLAHRIEQAATANSCWISEETHRLAKGSIAARSLGRVAIEGFATAVEVFELIADVSPGPSPGRSTANPAGFIGRGPELEKLLGHVDAAVQGRGGSVVLSGEPGIGKSRLCRELAARAAALGIRCVVQSAEASDRPSSYRLVGRWLRAWLDVRPEDSPRIVQQRLEDFASASSLDPAHVPPICSLLDLAIDSPEWQNLDPGQRAARIVAALIEAVQRCAGLAPQLVILEDLHLADPQTLAALQTLSSCLQGSRVLLVLTHRPEGDPPLGGDEPHLELGPLSESDSRALLTKWMGVDSQLDELKVLLSQRGAGNPLFLEESVRTLGESGHLVGEFGAFRFQGHLRTLRIPSSIQAIIASRVDGLDPEAKSLLQTAAVIGREFGLRLLATVTNATTLETLEARLSRLEERGFVLSGEIADGEEYTFKHSLTQEVVYRSLLGPRRREIHGRVMEGIERIHEGRLAEHTHELAEHAFAGRLWNEAARYRLRSCHVAIERSESREAVLRFERAVEELDEMPESQTTLKAAIDLRVIVLNAFLPMGEHHRMLRTLLEAEKLAQSVADERRLALVRSHLAMAYWLSGEHQRGLEAAESARDSATRIESSALLLGSTFNIGIIHHALGDHRRSVKIQRELLEQLRNARESDRMNWAGYPAVFVRTFLGQSCLELGLFDEASQCVSEGRALAQRFAHPYSLAMIDSVAGQVLLATGRPREARDLLAAALQASVDHDVLTMRPLLAARLASASLALGEVDRAIAALDPVLDPSVYERSGTYIWGDLFLAASEAYAARAEWIEAARFARDAESLCRRCGALGQLAHSLAQLAAIETQAGFRAAAEERLREAAAIASSLEMMPLLERLSP